MSKELDYMQLLVSFFIECELNNKQLLVAESFYEIICYLRCTNIQELKHFEVTNISKELVIQTLRVL